MAALRHRDQVSGRGQVVDISLYEPLLSVLGPDAAGYALEGVVRQRHGNTSDNASPRGTYRTLDDKWIALSASTPASATAVFGALGLADLLKDPRFATNDARVEFNELVDATIARAIGQRTLDEMRGLFESSDLTACPVYDIADITKDPHVVARGILIDVPDPALGAVRMTAPTPRLDATPATVRWVGPELGAHNREVYGALGVSEDEVEWIEAAVKKYPDLVSAGVRVPDPTNMAAAGQLDVELARTKARVMGEVHIRQVSRKIERDPSSPAFMKILELSAQRGVPIVIHDELTPAAAASLEAALAAHREAVIVLAHAGEAKPRDLERLLGRNANLRIDLSGMHFQRTPSLAKEKGPLHPAWKALIAKMPDRFLMGVDALAARLFEPAMLDRLMTWTRRVLGELPPDVAERVAWKNASVLYHLD